MSKPRLIDQVREEIRVRHYSLRTEKTYIQWIRRYILFHDKRHPCEMGEKEISAFLSHLAVTRHVSASTQNQALSAILFLYQKVLDQKLDWLEDVVRAKRPQRLPVVLTRSEVSLLLGEISGVNGLVARVLYASRILILITVRYMSGREKATRIVSRCCLKRSPTHSRSNSKQRTEPTSMT